MRYRVWFGERRDLEVVWLPTRLTSTAIDQAVGRLRGWALVRAAAIAGSAFLSPGSDGNGRVYLPLRHPCAPDPASGIEADVLPGGPIAVVRDVPLRTLLEHVDHFAEVVAPDGYRGAPEYQGGFHGTGLLTLPLFAAPARPPAELEFQGEGGPRRVLQSG